MVRVIAFAAGVLAGIALFVGVVMGVGRASAATATAQRPVVVAGGSLDESPAPPRTPSLEPFIASGDDPDDGGQLDLQGDEVTPAVARYRFDAQGNIYETHAPHTEVPRLGSPQT